MAYAEKVARHAMSLSKAEEIQAYLKAELSGLGLDYILEL
jgi:hypothetical protein